MTDDPMSAVREELDAIRRNFGMQLETQVGKIVGAWQAAEKGRGGSEAYCEVRDLTHSLAGNAGVLGFMEVSREAAALEEMLDQALEAGQHDAVDLQLRIDAAMGHLVGVAAESASPDEAI